MIRKFKSSEPSIGLRVYIDEQATVIGDVTLGDDCSVWPQTVIRGDINPSMLALELIFKMEVLCTLPMKVITPKVMNVTLDLM